jgi:hypothetical protein
MLLIAVGIGHRLLLTGIERSLTHSLALRAPLESIPLELPGWVGWQAPIDPRVRQVDGFEHDFINRHYREADGGRTVSVFIGYQGRPRSVFGHRAEVCYATHGWKELSDEPVEVRMPAGGPLPARIYEFESPRPDGGRMLVLSAYVVNGRFTNDSSALAGYNQRTPGLLGGRQAYAARVQLAMPVGVDRADDVRVLENLLTRLSEPLTLVLPYLS